MPLMTISVLPRNGIAASICIRIAGVAVETSVSPFVRRSGSLIGRDVHDVRAEGLDEVARRDMEVDPTGTAPDRHHRLVEGGGVDDHWEWSRCAEGGDGTALVAGHLPRLLGVGHRHALDAEMGAELRPVETPPARDEDE